MIVTINGSLKLLINHGPNSINKNEDIGNLNVCKKLLNQNLELRDCIFNIYNASFSPTMFSFYSFH